jgi:hypothetical protein
LRHALAVIGGDLLDAAAVGGSIRTLMHHDFAGGGVAA